MSRKKGFTIDDYLSLIPSDKQDIPTPPDTSSLPPLEGKRKLAEYYRSLANLAISREDERRARTRAMIILGARLSTVSSPAVQKIIRDFMAATDRPGDYAAVCEVVPWMAAQKPEESAS